MSTHMHGYCSMDKLSEGPTIKGYLFILKSRCYMVLLTARERSAKLSSEAAGR